MKKLVKVIAVIVCAMLCAFPFIACDGGDNNGNTGGGLKTYVMEAEYINLDGLVGAGTSNEASGVELIIGDGSAADKAKGWSSGYYIAFTYTAGLTFEFVFTSSAAASGAIVVRLGSEIGDITLDSSTFDVKLNGVSITYANVLLSESEMSNMVFSDKTITSGAQIVKGENKITLTVLNNALLGEGLTGGPMIDCIKIKTTAALTWTDKTENPSRRGEI